MPKKRETKKRRTPKRALKTPKTPKRKAPKRKVAKRKVAKKAARSPHREKLKHVKCDPQSFRWKTAGKHKILICCPKGHFDHRHQICKVSTTAATVLHPPSERR